MRLSDARINDYPRLARYVRDDMPNLVHARAIVDAIKKFSGRTPRETIVEALQWGYGPEIIVVKRLVCAGTPAYGCYTWGSDQVHVDGITVGEFESGGGIVKSVDGLEVPLIGVTLLHELTHWADAQDGVNDPIPGDPSGEEGNAFERAVFGSVLG